MSVIQEKDRTWTVQVRIKQRDGTVRHHKKRGFERKKDALEYEAQIKSDKPKFHMKVKDFLPIYMNDKKSELKERTLLMKKDVFNKHIFPYFGEMYVDEIKTSDIQEWQNIMCTKNYQPTYLRIIANQFAGLLNHACNIYDMESNPYKKIKKMGRSDANRVEFWTYEEYQKFISILRDDIKYFTIFEVLYYTGMREGEVLALTPRDIDLAGRVIHVRKTYCRRNRKDIITEPKTEQSIRDIVIPQFLADELRTYMDKIYGLEEDQRIFPLVAEAVQHKMKRTIDKAGVPNIRVHSLRHSHVAYLINQGVQPLLIKERLGHADIKMTLNTYGHLYPSEQTKVADLLDDKRKNP